MIRKLSSPVYNYFYDYQNEMSFNAYFGPCEKPLGVTHGDELTSIFALHRLNEQDVRVSKRMVDIWYKFVSSEWVKHKYIVHERRYLFTVASAGVF